MEVAAVRARAMGLTTTQAFNDMATGIGRMSPMILDNLGIITKGWAEEAKAAGVAYDQQFILNKVLEQGGEMLKDTGGLALDNAAAFEILEAQSKDFFNTVKTNTAESVGPFVDDLAFLVTGLNDSTDAMEELGETGQKSIRVLRGITTLGLSELFKKGADALHENIDAQQEANRVNEAAKKATKELTIVEVERIESLEDIEAATKATSDAIESKVSLINKIQSAEDSYYEKSADLSEKALMLEYEKQELLDRGYTIYSEQVMDINMKLAQNADEVDKLTESYKRQSLEFVSGILQQNLARDGWTEKEFEAFAAQQVAWGLWSEDVSAAAQQAMTDANNITAAIERIPSEKTFTFTTFTVGASEVASLTGANNTPHASGGSFVIPQSYGNEGFMLGNGDTASGGEKLTIDPAGSSGNADIIAAIQDNAIDTRALARAFVSAMQQAGT